MNTKLLTFGALALAMTGQTNAAGGEYNYATNNGEDWPTISPDCGLTNQSPIDLKTSGYPIKSAKDDNFNKMYTNQVGDVTIEWKGGHTTQVAVNKEGQATQTFSSNLAKSQFGANSKFTGVQFHFHAGSEHTVDGKRHDLEMHTVHLAHETLSNFGFAAMGIMFSVEDYSEGISESTVAIIDKFFDSMDWEKQDDPKVAEVPYGDLMLEVDMDNRWVYKGSVTTPPCGQSVYWNVLTTVYPIKQKHLDLFKKQMERGEHDLAKTGNWRLIQKEDKHGVFMVQSEAAGSSYFGLAAIFILISAILAVVSLTCFVLNRRKEHSVIMKTNPGEGVELAEN